MKARSTAFPDGGLYVFADSQPYAQAMAVDAGPQGVGRSGHGHADALSLRLTMDGRRWLVDAGTRRLHFEGSRGSKHISRDGRAQHDARGWNGPGDCDEPFSWTQIPTTQAENWIVGRSFTYFVGSHNGYARMADPVLHRRHVLKIAGGLWLVRDMALGRTEHELEMRWHFAPDLEVQIVGPGRVEISRAGAGLAESGQSALSLMVPDETVWQTSMEVSRTLISCAYGAYQPAPMVRCHARVLLPAETATALVPGSDAIRQGSDPPIERRFTSMGGAAVQVYELDSHDASHKFFFALGEAWSFGPWSSDASVLYCRIEKEKLAHLILIGGTHAAWHGQPVLKAASQSSLFRVAETGST